MRLAYFTCRKTTLLSRDQVRLIGGSKERPRVRHNALGANHAVANARKVISRSKDSLACFRDMISPAHKRRHETDGIVSERDAS
jgi:hypothetical protein